MRMKKKVLIVEDLKTIRQQLNDILGSYYDVIEATDGSEAMALLSKCSEDISAIITDIYMPGTDGYRFMELLHDNKEYKDIPVIVASSDNSVENEKKALKMGAWDFIAKPYDKEILLFRIKNVINRSELGLLEELKYISEYDELTGIYSKKKFFEDTERMLRLYPEKTFAVVRYDVDRFQLINSFYGVKAGDGLLIYIGKTLKKILSFNNLSTYGRITADVFGFCLPYDQEELENLLFKLRTYLEEYNKQCDIVPSFGIYITKPGDKDVERMYNYASLAARKVKGNYLQYYYYYNDELSRKIEKEQIIINEMNRALNEEQFDVFLQPKYNILNGRVCGAEALVRWIHPNKGIISPAEFIPLFERNGFIAKLDYYVWEKVCQYIRRWLDEGRHVQPISVNVSRVNVYNPNIVNIFCELVEKYNVPPELLGLELTESAYTDNPTAISDVMSKLQEYGFTILMDDFGSGYSSLNMLKDVKVDIIKADMNFLSTTDTEGRGASILASVIRMSKWLKVPVIVEGVENVEQLNFLKSIGCEYVQGYYFAKPMICSEYEKLMDNTDIYSITPVRTHNNFDVDMLLNENSQIKQVFNNVFQATALYEFDGKCVNIIRANDGYYSLVNSTEAIVEFENTNDYILDEHKDAFICAFNEVSNNKDRAECVYVRRCKGLKAVWIRIRLKYVYEISGVHLVLGELEDITIQHETDLEMSKYRELMEEFATRNYNMLIVDDTKMDRAILCDEFGATYNIFEANNGKEAIKILEQENIDIILLDLDMPGMSGEKFLEYRRQNVDVYAIPVVITTSTEDIDEQVKMLNYGISDYVIKPYATKIVAKRVNNVMEANIRMKEVLRKYIQISRLAKIDQMTELYNRVSTIQLVEKILKSGKFQSNALVMLDIDNFKNVNDIYGHIAGDTLINQIATLLKKNFGIDDIIGRMGGDEFVVFMSDISDAQVVAKKCVQFRKRLLKEITLKDVGISCSFGIAMSPENGKTFQELYKCADDALYEAKKLGKNQGCVYSEKKNEE